MAQRNRLIQRFPHHCVLLLTRQLATVKVYLVSTEITWRQGGKTRSLSRHTVTRYSQLTYVIAKGSGFNAIIYYFNHPNFHFCCIHVHPQVAKQVNTEKLIVMRVMYNTHPGGSKAKL